MFNLTIDESEIKRLIKEAIREEVALQLKEVVGNNINNKDCSKQKKNDAHVIKGVRGLATFLGCGINTAQNIIKSKTLLNKKIQYNTGKGWRFKKEKLSELLEKEPEILKKVRKK